MPSRVYILLIYCSCLIAQGCREPFEVNVASGNQLLAVSGMITDQPGPYTVRLSRSNELNSIDFPPETGASVVLESRSGESELLIEEEPGIYKTAVNGIQGRVGEAYRIRIQTSGDKNYESDWKLLKQSPPIDSLYFEYREQQREEGFLKGLQIYLDTHDPENNTEYYRYEWKETWTYNADLPAQYIYLGNDTRESFPAKRRCWIDQTSTAISIASSEQNSSDIVSRHPILYVTTETTRLRVRYSLLVRQYALDEQEYIFWKGIRETSIETGSLFDKQPQSITGNLHEVNTQEPVLGYFSASGVSEKRIFMVQNDLPENTKVDATLTQQCFDNQVYVEKSAYSEDEITDLLNQGMVFFDWDVLPGAGIIGYIFTTPICSDCTVQGGTTDKPVYWPD